MNDPPNLDVIAAVFPTPAAPFMGAATELSSVGHRWVVWMMQDRDGRPTKIPYQCADDEERENGYRIGERAKTNDPATWGWWPDAVRDHVSGHYDGVGLMLLGGAYSVIDLDKCRDPVTGDVQEWARAICAEVASYTEVSPSKTGLHIFVIGKLPPGRRRIGQLEMYGPDDARFMTITGWRVDSWPMRAVDLTAIHRRLMPVTPLERAHKALQGATGVSPHVADAYVLERATTAKNGQAVRDLLDGTDTRNHSEAVAALLARLVFWTQDPEQIDRIVTEHFTPLDATKWDRVQSGSTWGALEIDKALARVGDTWGGDTGATGVEGRAAYAALHPAVEAEPETDPAGLLDDVAAFLSAYVSFPSAEHCDAVALWVAVTHTYDAFDSSPRLALLSAEKQSGKTRCLEVLALLVQAPQPSINMTPAAMFRLIELEHPTLLFDEVDAIYGRYTAKDHEDERGIINAGHRRGATVARCVGEGKRITVKTFDVYSPVALAGIGDLPDTIMDRSIIVRMRRRGPDEQVQPFRQRLVRPIGAALRGRLAAWVAEISATVGDAWPEMPDGITDRPADVWEPLFALADAAGGHWPERARAACLTIESARLEGVGSPGVALLVDIRTVFGQSDKLASTDLAHMLAAMPEAQWGDLHGRPLDQRGLAQRLRKYGITPAPMRSPVDYGVWVRGYRRTDFADAWERYCGGD